MTIQESMTQILEREAQAIRNILYSTDYDKAVELILEHVHRRGGKLVTSGMGKAGQVARNLAATLCSTGTTAVYLHPSEAQHGDLGIVQPNDVILLISNSGTTREVIEITDLAKNLYPSVPFILITGNPDCELARRVDATLLTGGAPEVCTLGLTPTTSITVMRVICDVLVVNVMSRISFTAADYAKRHNGGALGTKSRADSAITD